MDLLFLNIDSYLVLPNLIKIGWFSSSFKALSMYSFVLVLSWALVGRIPTLISITLIGLVLKTPSILYRALFYKASKGLRR